MRIIDGLIVRRGTGRRDSKTIKAVHSTSPFTQLSGISDTIALGLLQKVQTGTVALAALNSMCKALKVTLRIQQKIMETLGTADWSETRSEFSKSTETTFIQSWVSVFATLRVRDPIPQQFLCDLDLRKKQDTKIAQQDRVRSREVGCISFCSMCLKLCAHKLSCPCRFMFM